MEFLASDITDPCNPDKTSEDIVNDALAAVEDCDEAGFETAMDGVDKITPSNEFLNCPFYNCLCNYYLQNGNEFWCDNLDYIFNDNAVNLNLDIHNYGPEDGKVDFIDVNKGEFYLSLHKSDCNSDGDKLYDASEDFPKNTTN